MNIVVLYQEHKDDQYYKIYYCDLKCRWKTINLRHTIIILNSVLFNYTQNKAFLKSRK